jgi:hypothetical protein
VVATGAPPAERVDLLDVGIDVDLGPGSGDHVRAQGVGERGAYGDRFLWTSDFPHADHTPEYIDDLEYLSLASRSGISTHLASVELSENPSTTPARERQRSTATAPARDSSDTVSPLPSVWFTR